MTPTSPRFFGGCLCGTICYEIQRKHLSAWHCYCTMCRKAHARRFRPTAAGCRAWARMIRRPDRYELDQCHGEVRVLRVR